MCYEISMNSILQSRPANKWSKNDSFRNTIREQVMQFAHINILQIFLCTVFEVAKHSTSFILHIRAKTSKNACYGQYNNKKKKINKKNGKQKGWTW